MIEVAVSLAVAAAAAGGLYLAMSRDVISIVIGLALLGSAANLFVFAAGRLEHPTPPLVPAGLAAPPDAVADPLPQALVLTAIVIGFALIGLGIALVLALQARTGRNDANGLAYAEPPPRASGEPGELP